MQAQRTTAGPTAFPSEIPDPHPDQTHQHLKAPDKPEVLICKEGEIVIVQEPGRGRGGLAIPPQLLHRQSPTPVAFML